MIITRERKKKGGGGKSTGIEISFPDEARESHERKQEKKRYPKLDDKTKNKAVLRAAAVEEAQLESGKNKMRQNEERKETKRPTQRSELSH